jgi:hypothetical protein
LAVGIDYSAALQLNGGTFHGLAMLVNDGAGYNQLSASAVVLIVHREPGERPLHVAGGIGGVLDVHHGINVGLKVERGVMNAQEDLHRGGLLKALAADRKEKHGVIETDTDFVALIAAAEGVGSLALELIYDSGDCPVVEVFLDRVDEQDAVIGFVKIGAQGDGRDAQACASRSASRFQEPVLTIEQGCLQGDVTNASEGAEAVCGQMVCQKKIVVSSGEAEAAERLEVRFTGEIFLILKQTTAPREMEKMIPIGETLHGGVIAAVNHCEGREEQTIVKVALEENTGADVLGPGGDHEGSGITDASGTHEDGQTGVARVALHEQAARADAEPGAVKGISEIFVTCSDVQAMEFESVGGPKYKMAVSESGGSTESALWEEGSDFTACSTQQGAAATRKLKDLSADGNAKQQDAQANTEHQSTVSPAAARTFFRQPFCFSQA